MIAEVGDDQAAVARLGQAGGLEELGLELATPRLLMPVPSPTPLKPAIGV